MADRSPEDESDFLADQDLIINSIFQRNFSRSRGSASETRDDEACEIIKLLDAIRTGTTTESLSKTEAVGFRLGLLAASTIIQGRVEERRTGEGVEDEEPSALQRLHAQSSGETKAVSPTGWMRWLFAGDEEMTEVKATATPLCCNFCGKRKEEVQKLVAGPNVFICDECIDLCHEIVHGKPTHDEQGRIIDEDESVPSASD